MTPRSLAYVSDEWPPLGDGSSIRIDLAPAAYAPRGSRDLPERSLGFVEPKRMKERNAAIEICLNFALARVRERNDAKPLRRDSIDHWGIAFPHRCAHRAVR
jgi:hypothetical protein